MHFNIIFNRTVKKLNKCTYCGRIYKFKLVTVKAYHRNFIIYYFLPGSLNFCNIADIKIFWQGNNYYITFAFYFHCGYIPVFFHILIIVLFL